MIHTLLTWSTLAIRQTAWFALPNLNIAWFVAPLTSGTRPIPVLAVLIFPAAQDAAAIRVAQRFLVRTVGVFAALWLADEVLVELLAGQGTGYVVGFVLAVDDLWPVADRTVGVLDALVEK